MPTNMENIPLTASEISSLWATYQQDTLEICGIGFFLTHIEDQQIQKVLEQALNMAKKRKEMEAIFFEKEGYPIPQGFTDMDVNFHAPRLFSDKLYLKYIYHMTNVSTTTSGLYLAIASRADITDFYAGNLVQMQSFHKQVLELMKEKGIHIRPPALPIPEKVDFVTSDDFLAGWFGDKRPLLGIEIAHLAFNSKRNAIGQALITGFSQVAKSKEVRHYFERGREISGKHLEIFSNILRENYLPTGTLSLAGEVTDSTISPFSDKLMMNLITTLIGAGIGQYGTAISASPRHDLGTKYTRLMAEIARYSNDGAKILIDNSWMEKPPIAADRKELAK